MTKGTVLFGTQTYQTEPSLLSLVEVEFFGEFKF